MWEVEESQREDVGRNIRGEWERKEGDGVIDERRKWRLEGRLVIGKRKGTGSWEDNRRNIIEYNEIKKKWNKMNLK